MSTICAISTAPGIGGIAVARISGPQAIAIAQTIWHGQPLTDAVSHTAHLGTIADPETDEQLDQAVATVYRNPRSFTGEDVVELAVHGSLYIQQELINLLIRQGCRLAEPGEFTRRAFANGRMDLAQAESVADVIASTSRAANRLAQTQMRGQFSAKLSTLRDQLLNLAALLELELDFSEEDVEFANRQQLAAIATETLQTIESLADTFSTGDAIRHGIPVAIVGKPNAGKSSVLNLLVGDNRAIVSDIPGTTRDTIEDTATIGPLTFRFIDTAGLRHTDDTVENLGIDRTWSAITRARVILWVQDAHADSTDTSEFLTRLLDSAPADAAIIRLLNKSDLTPAVHSGDDGLAAVPDNHCDKRDFPAAHKGDDGLAVPERIHTLPFSAVTSQGLTQLRNLLTTLFDPAQASTPDAILVTNARHYQALRSASTSLRRVLSALTPSSPSPSSSSTSPSSCSSSTDFSTSSTSPSPSSSSTNFSTSPSSTSSTPYPISADFIAQDVREAIHHLSSITGSITTPDILSAIFSRFCIGK